MNIVRMLKLRLGNDSLVRNNAIFFIGSLLVAFLNYCYHPVISRLLSVSEFGEVAAILSLMVQASVLLGVFNLLAAHHTANTRSDRDLQGEDEHSSNDILGIPKERDILEEIYALVFILMTIGVIAIIVFAPRLMAELKFDETSPFILLALITLVSVPLTRGTSVLQGRQMFKQLSFASLIQAGGKLLFSVFLAAIGFGIFGALGGILVAQIITLLYLSDWKFSALQFLPKRFPRFNGLFMRELGYATLIFITTITIAFLYTGDTILAKYFFTPEVAGLYGGIAVIARIIFFATGSITGVLFPAITLNLSKPERYRVLAKSAIFIALVGGAGLMVIAGAPELVISMLLGVEYLPYSALLPTLAFVLFLASCVNMLAMFLVAQRKFVLIPIMLLGAILLVLTNMGSHATPSDLVDNLLVTNLSVLAMLLMYLAYDWRQKPSEVES